VLDAASKSMQAVKLHISKILQLLGLSGEGCWLTLVVIHNGYYCKKTSQFKTTCKDDITQLKQQISKRRYYLAAHRRVVNVLASNSAFLIFAVLVV